MEEIAGQWRADSAATLEQLLRPVDVLRSICENRKPLPPNRVPRALGAPSIRLALLVFLAPLLSVAPLRFLIWRCAGAL